MNLRSWLEQKTELNGESTFIYWNEKTTSYRDFNLGVNKAANVFSELGLKKGSKCAIMMQNCPEYLYVLFGLAKIGAIAACLDVNLRGDGLQYLIDSADCSAVVIDTDLVRHYEAVEKGLHKVKQVLLYPDIPSGRRKNLSLASCMNSASAKPPLEVDIKGRDPVGFIHTGGTTGLPKWCVISSNYYIAVGQCFADFLGITRDDVVFNPLPLFHMNPQGYYVMGSLAANAAILITERFSASAFWEQVQRHKVTVLVLHVGAVDILKKRPPSEQRSHCVRVSYFADAEFMKRFNIPVTVSAFGSTEAGGLICLHRYRLPLTAQEEALPSLRSLCGKPRDDVAIRIADDEEQEMPVGQVGSILVRPAKPHVIFDGYYGAPDKTLESFRDLWFHTGDQGYIDDNGDLHFAGRKTESIRIKGQFVDISLLEKLIMSLPQVRECAVVPVAGQVGGDEIKAAIQLEPGAKITPEEVIRHCEDKIAYFMIPRYIEFVDEIPHTSMEKVAKVTIKETGVTNAWDREASGYKIKRD